MQNPKLLDKMPIQNTSLTGSTNINTPSIIRFATLTTKLVKITLETPLKS